MNSFEKLKTKLAELFQLDQADLDFGIYRIMNARRDEISRFLESDLLPQVRKAFGEYKSSDKAEIQKELDKVVAGVKAAGMDPEQAPKVKELRARLAGEAVDVTALENEVYDHLYSFFSRYYDEGDFISLRRYKEGVYAIPYEGEEVKLHWANHDQYYIKTTEYFRNYTFKTPSGHRVHFKIVEADTEKDNVKASNGNDRRFFLYGEKPVAEENGELVIRFEYRPDGEKRRQDVINAETARHVIEDLSTEKLTVWQQRLSTKWKRASGTETDKTILDKHLFDYTRRNTFDYFIHKDLGGFLRRELDFYIKNEVMRLDDVEEETAPRVEQYLSKIKVIRRIAHKIIDFLAQIENFQKKLWLKKKFVVETNYCMTLDRVPEEFYPEIVANEAQREEWVRLLAIDETRKDLAGAVDYSEPLTVEFLKANPYLVLDTRHFSEEFKSRLISAIEDIDGQCDGLLVHGENQQALSLLMARHQKTIECIYIDPPYNTGSDEFIYKDRYRHASWIAMIDSRLRLSKPFLSDTGAIFVSVDDNEQPHLRAVMDAIFGVNNLITTMVWEGGLKNDSRFTSVSQDYIVNYVLDKERLAATGRRWRTRKEGIDEMYKQVERLKKKHGTGWDTISSALREWYRHLPKGHPSYAHKHYSCVDEKGVYFPGDISWPGGGGPRYEVLHPKTRKPVAIPQRGWVFAKPETMQQAIKEGRVHFGPDETSVPNLKRYLHETEGQVLPAVFYKDRRAAFKELRDILGGDGFANPKDPYILAKLIEASGEKDSLILDFFAGSGTTAHAVINLNREDGGKRKYILVEMGDYFDTVLMPRIKKVVYSKDWKDGKPVSRDTGISHMFKYICLESYEDALANIELKRTGPQQLLLDQSASFRESYMLKYMLETEPKGSSPLLNSDWFDDPFNYKLLVGTGSVGETKAVTVDLVETFNWLLGLRVRHMDSIRGFRIVEGTNPKGEKVLVIWRKIRDLSETDPDRIRAQREQANRDLEAFFRKQQYNTLDSEFDVIYVNGDNNLMNVPLDPEKEGVEPRYKVRLIEEEFKRLMFDVADV